MSSELQGYATPAGRQLPMRDDNHGAKSSARTSYEDIVGQQLVNHSTAPSNIILQSARSQHLCSPRCTTTWVASPPTGRHRRKQRDTRSVATCSVDHLLPVIKVKSPVINQFSPGLTSYQPKSVNNHLTTNKMRLII